MSERRANLMAIQPGPDAPASAWVARISACWRASVEAILEVGRLLAAAKEALPHGTFGTMIAADLPFTASTAQRLMAIAADPKLSNAAHVQHLPPSWGTLYELTKLSEEQFVAAVEAGKIRPDMERREISHGARALMQGRVEPDDSLDFFPTPPWATRTLFEIVLPHLGVERIDQGWEPAEGEGHMTEVLREYIPKVFASDVYDYGRGAVISDFLADHPLMPAGATWIITNPPFTGREDRALAFAKRALSIARDGVALFVRSQWLVEGGDRYRDLFEKVPPTLCAFFSERVPLHKARWEPDGSTMTAYSWVVWIVGEKPFPPLWIPPICRERYTKDDDAERFTAHPVKPFIPHDPETGEILEPADEAA